MSNNNIYLQNAKNIKDDEFYTTYETIEKELIHYTKHFENKTVLCNCDDPFESNFCKYFLKNFNVLKIKRLICTSYKSSKMISTQLTLFDSQEQPLAPNNGYVLDVKKFSNISGEISDEIISNYLSNSKVIKKLKGDGDFRSTECIKYLKQCDIVVTNPPFSLFKELVSEITKRNKKFLLIGNQNALTYKEIFPLIQKNEAWTGYQFGEMKFRVPNSSKPRKTRFWVDETGQKWRSLGNAMWLTNLDIDRIHKTFPLRKKYNINDYPKYDNYDAINVKTINDIPCDYTGIMGVPITIINKYNSEQFEIIGEANHGSDNEFDLFKPTIKGKEIFKRILIRNKLPNIDINIQEFRILDLFSGAGGFSYGMEKNKHFKTEIALDYNEKALKTFKYNMPETTIISGDITNSEIKDKVIKLSKEKNINMIIGGPPCQGFSLKGKKLGLEDSRNYLFNEYLSIVEILKPEVFVIENVRALLHTSAGWFKNQIVEKVQQMGYWVDYGVLTASDFGVPQARQRAIFICSKNKKIALPKATCDKPVTVRDAIYDLAYLNSNEGNFELDYTTEATSDYQRLMRKNSFKLYNHKASNHADIAIKKLQMIPPECGKESLPKELIGNQKFSGTWGRLRWDAVSPTIDTRFDASSNGTNNHPFLNRAITPREAARIQSFDDNFVFLGTKVNVREQIGNAVPPLMAKGIADQIYEVLGGEK